MSFCIICFCRRFHYSQQHPFSSNLQTELEDSRKFTLNSLMALLAILTISGSRVLQPVVLTLLIYTISLRLAINTCFLHNYPALSRFLHVIPLFSTSCIACVMLVSDLQSPVLAAVGLLLGVLPMITIVIHHGGRCAQSSAEELPMQMQDVSTSAVLGATETTRSS